MSAGVRREELPDRALGEYMNVKEAAEFVRVSPRTLRNKMAAGVLRIGVHYFRTAGLGPRFKRSALEAWIEGDESREQTPGPLGDIPMARQPWTRSPKVDAGDRRGL